MKNKKEFLTKKLEALKVEKWELEFSLGFMLELRDESTQKEQMDNLNALHNQTNEKIKINEKLTKHIRRILNGEVKMDDTEKENQPPITLSE